MSNPHLRLGMLVLATTLLAAAELHVSPTGNDGHDGSADKPLRTLAAAAARLRGGDTLLLHDGEWRETLKLNCKRHSGSEGAPTVIAAAPGAKPVISGSDVVDGWVRHEGEVWKRTDWPHNSQMLFVDGKPLRQISATGAKNDHVRVKRGNNLADLVDGSFFYDVAAKTLYLRQAGFDPSKRLIEASVRPRLLTINLFEGDAIARLINVRGLGFRHANTSVEDIWGAAVVSAYKSTFTNCWFRWNDFAGLELAGGSVVEDCDASDNGSLGYNIRGHHHGWVIRRSSANRNNWRQYYTGEHAGGLKCIPDGSGTVEDSEFIGNFGSGVWFDYCLTGKPIIIRRNRILGNLGNETDGGVKIEGVKNSLVESNLIQGNSGNGILVFGSNNTRILANTIIGGTGMAAIQVGGVPREKLTQTDTRIAGNIIASNDTTYDLLLQPDSNVVSGTVSNGNLFWRGGGLVQHSMGGTYTNHLGRMHTDLAAWTTATGHDATSVVADPLLLPDGKPGTGSPALGRGQAEDGVGSDLLGTARGAAPWTLGAYATAAATKGASSPALIAPTAEVWFDDVLPAGSRTHVDQSGWKKENPHRIWHWIADGPKPASGRFSAELIGRGQGSVLTLDGTAPFRLEAGDRLACLVWLDPKHPPSGILVQLTDGSHTDNWPEHTKFWPAWAVWGEDRLSWGAEPARKVTAALPKIGEWIRLELSAEALNLVGKELKGFAIGIPNGRLCLDRVHVLRQAQ